MVASRWSIAVAVSFSVLAYPIPIEARGGGRSGGMVRTPTPEVLTRAGSLAVAPVILNARVTSPTIVGPASPPAAAISGAATSTAMGIPGVVVGISSNPTAAIASTAPPSVIAAPIPQLAPLAPLSSPLPPPITSGGTVQNNGASTPSSQAGIIPTSVRLDSLGQKAPS